MTTVRVEAIGIAAPGLHGWSEGAAVLDGRVAYGSEPLVLPAPELLPPNERRRTTQVIRLALQAGREALAGSPRAADSLCTVFASSLGDAEIVDRICRALNEPGRPVSPTLFHNSVHNAPAGYWSIATGATGASTSVAAFDRTFQAALLEAYSFVAVEANPVLLIGYDHPAPEPLRTHTPVAIPFATALLLGPSSDATTGTEIALAFCGDEPDTMPDPALESLRLGNPIARALPLIAAIAARRMGRVVLPYSSSVSLAVQCRS